MSKSFTGGMTHRSDDERRQADGARPDALPFPGSSGGPQLCGDIDMRIARDGTWFYHGSPIGRKPLVKLFASVLKRDAAGDYLLITPAEQCRIKVDDAPFVAVAMTVEGQGRDQNLVFTTNLDDTMRAGPDHPIRVETAVATGEPSPYGGVRDSLEALISRAVFYDLVELGVEETVDGAPAFGVWSGGAFFALGPLDEGQPGHCQEM